RFRREKPVRQRSPVSRILPAYLVLRRFGEERAGTPGSQLLQQIDDMADLGLFRRAGGGGPRPAAVSAVTYPIRVLAIAVYAYTRRSPERIRRPGRGIRMLHRPFPPTP